MTLLDASVIIDVLRDKDWSLLGKMKMAGGAVCGVTRAEVLAGARGQNDRSRLVTLLDEFQQAALPDALWDEAGNAAAELRRRGVTVPLIDVAIMVTAVTMDCELWARDAHFRAMQVVFPKLRLYAEAPSP